MSQMVPPLSTEQRNAAWLIKLLKAPADTGIMPHIFQPRPLLQAAQCTAMTASIICLSAKLEVLPKGHQLIPQKLIHFRLLQGRQKYVVLRKGFLGDLRAFFRITKVFRSKWVGEPVLSTLYNIGTQYQWQEIKEANFAASQSKQSQVDLGLLLGHKQ